MHGIRVEPRQGHPPGQVRVSLVLVEVSVAGVGHNALHRPDQAGVHEDVRQESSDGPGQGGGLGEVQPPKLVATVDRAAGEDAARHHEQELCAALRVVQIHLMLLRAAQHAVGVPRKDVGDGGHQAQEGRESLGGGGQEEEGHECHVRDVVRVAGKLEAAEGKELLGVPRAETRPGADDEARDPQEGEVDERLHQEGTQDRPREEVGKELRGHSLLGGGRPRQG
mmetsp:Transcript_53130/g.164663  ORF Transcript_53130/g.164663 Transcript_53130/m.164663 type:complete len:224 (-) Transcript_53130:37-708(-)